MLQEYLSLGTMQRRHFSLEQINLAVDFMHTLTYSGKHLCSISYRHNGSALCQEVWLAFHTNIDIKLKSASSIAIPASQYSMSAGPCTALPVWNMWGLWAFCVTWWPALQAHLSGLKTWWACSLGRWKTKCYLEAWQNLANCECNWKTVRLQATSCSLLVNDSCMR